LELRRQRATLDDLGPTQRRRLKKLSAEIETAERRLARIPEDMLAGMIGEIQRMKSERAELEAEIAATGAGAEPLADIEKRLRERIRDVTAALQLADVGKVREVLSMVVERVVVSHDKTAVLHATPSCLCAVGTPWGS
jgi:predicted  nucleic acid-binding Zn-ribbon protein